MPTDFFALLRRDHRDLARELERLLDPTATMAQLRASMDEVRLGLVAHAEAEDIVLAPYDEPAEQLAGGTGTDLLRDERPTARLLAALVTEMRTAHRQQQRVLTILVSSRPASPGFRDRAHELLDLIDEHDRDEAEVLIPALRAHAPVDYSTLAGAYATERLRQLAMLQPSAPVVLPFTPERSRAS